MSTLATQPASQTGADLLVKIFEAQGVEYIFGDPDDGEGVARALKLNVLTTA